MNRSSRRQFLITAGAWWLAGTTGCSASFRIPSTTRRLHRVGRMSATLPNPTTDGLTAAFRQGLLDLGYVEGETIVIEERYAEGVDQLAGPAAELRQLNVEAILVPSTTDARAILPAVPTMPIVCAGAGDLVASGLAASLSRPEGMVTGLSTPELLGKQLQLLQQVIPTLTRLAVLVTNVDRSGETQRGSIEAAARELGADAQFVQARASEELEGAFDTVVHGRAHALYIPGGPLFAANQSRMAELAIERRLPTCWFQSEAIGRGGLMAYGANRTDLHRRAATFVDKILKGARPGDLPVEQPNMFDFAINLRTAQALGITIPPTVLAQATEIIQ